MTTERIRSQELEDLCLHVKDEIYRLITKQYEIRGKNPHPIELTHAVLSSIMSFCASLLQTINVLANVNLDEMLRFYSDISQLTPEQKGIVDKLCEEVKSIEDMQKIKKYVFDCLEQNKNGSQSQNGV